VRRELTSVAVDSTPLDRYRPLVDAGRWKGQQRVLGEAASALHGRAVWNVNSTARGGGVAEMLAALIPYERGSGIDARWVVIEGDDAFFSLTKRIHGLLHGVDSEVSVLSQEDRVEYERTLAENASSLTQMVRPGDLVILHDPQTAGLAPALARHGCRVIWRCHIGVDHPNDVARGAWDFLRPYVAVADAAVFSRRAYTWEGLDRDRTAIIAPAIDAFAPKNQELDQEMVASTLRAGGLLEPGHDGDAATFVRRDGTTAKVERAARLLQDRRPPPDAQLVVQVSRWDPLKDPVGVMKGFAAEVAPRTDGHLLLAGPAVASVADDPQQPEILAELEALWRGYDEGLRQRIHIAQLPMDDEDENAALVNAIQRHATVVVQKSLAEGFGLTVAEAMWKSRPVVASRLGGIEDQIEDGRSGLLVDDPQDLAGFGRAVSGLLKDAARAERLGEAARERVCERFLAPRHLQEQSDLLHRLAEA
jgi:trehalose synthase